MIFFIFYYIKIIICAMEAGSGNARNGSLWTVGLPWRFLFMEVHHEGSYQRQAV
jgi:hypothetical protein